jgi:hypothetical protein
VFGVAVLTFSFSLSAPPLALAADNPDPLGTFRYDGADPSAARDEAPAPGPLASAPESERRDANALTDDRSVTVPTGWWTYTNVSEASVTSFLTANSARLTDVEIHSIVSGQPRFTVRMVRNSGAYAVPGWWWYFGQTFTQIGQKLDENNARLIDLEPYINSSGALRYAAVMVSNTGGAARAWTYLSGVSSTQISSHIDRTGHRLIDLDTYFIGPAKFYSAVFVANTGTDAKSWQWWLNQTSSGVSSRLSAFNGRLVDLERLPNGLYNVVMVKNTGADAAAWWWRLGFASLSDLNNFANQLAVRPVDVETYVVSGQRRYSGVFIDNANAATRRIRDVFAERFLDGNGLPTRGIFEAYLKQVPGSVIVDLNSRRSAETASSLKSLHLLHAMRRVQANTDNLASSFTYYDYIAGTFNDRKNACPDPAKETLANRRTDYDLEKGLDEMMRISDNRTTRGVVLRYGFAAINATGDLAGMVGTQLRHNIGCAYFNLATGKFDTGLRNDTTAADLAGLFERVWNSSLLNGTPRTEFLESANPATGLDSTSDLQKIINEEAAALGKLAIADDFGALVRRWGKGGSYGTCLPDSAGACGQKVIIRSGAGIIGFPIKVSGRTAYRTYVFGRFISDVPVADFAGTDVTNYEATYNKASNELYREVVRSALQTW